MVRVRDIWKEVNKYEVEEIVWCHIVKSSHVILRGFYALHYIQLETLEGFYTAE